MGLLAAVPALDAVVTKLLDYIPDPAQKARAAQEWQAQMLTLAQGSDKAQAAVIGDITGLLASLLGIGTLRTVEKLQGVARKRL
jgi:hypothetical protein